MNLLNLFHSKSREIKLPLEARIVRIIDGYYLQLKQENGNWTFACGYHRGAPGYYNYQFERSANSEYLMKYSLPAIYGEMRAPTLPQSAIAEAHRKRIKEPLVFDEIIEVPPERLTEECLSKNPLA